MTAPRQKKPMIFDLNQNSDRDASVKESLMNTHKNPMITPTPNGTTMGGGAEMNLLNQHNRITVSEQEPFQMSESASNIVPGSEDKGSAANLLSSHLGSSYKS